MQRAQDAYAYKRQEKYAYKYDENILTYLLLIVKIFTAKKENAEREMQEGVPKRSLADATSSAPKILGHSNTIANNLLRADQVPYDNSILQKYNLSTPKTNFSP